MSESLLLLGEDQCHKFGCHAYVIFKPLILKNKEQDPSSHVLILDLSNLAS